MLAPAILAEIGSGATTLASLADPVVAPFLTAAYGFPLLVVHEIRARLRLAEGGLFLLGLAYGVLNEGLLAQTLIRFDGVPIDKFDRYLCVAGFNFSWAALIVPWHALFSILFPLALSEAWFPGAADSPLLGDRLFRPLAGLLAIIVAFLGLARAPHPQMFACALAIGALALAATALASPSADEAPPTPPRRQFAFGFIAYPVTIIATSLVAAAHAAAFVFVAWAAAASATIVGLARLCGVYSPSRAPRLAAGAYASLGAFHAVAAAKGSMIEGAIGLAVAAVFSLWAWVDWRREATV